MHQQHVNCLINTWGLPGKTWLLIACNTAFYAIIYVISILGFMPGLYKKSEYLDDPELYDPCSRKKTRYGE